MSAYGEEAMLLKFKILGLIVLIFTAVEVYISRNVQINLEDCLQFHDIEECEASRSWGSHVVGSTMFGWFLHLLGKGHLYLAR